MNAAPAPSVEVMGAAMDTLPVDNAVYASRSPRTLPKPAIASRAHASASSGGRGSAATIGIAAMSPMSITQPRSTRDPSTPAAREAHSVAVPQANAATAPPTMASIGRGCRTHRPPGSASCRVVDLVGVC